MRTCLRTSNDRLLIGVICRAVMPMAAASAIAIASASAQSPPEVTTTIKAPADVRCLVVTVAGERTVKRSFDVIPGQDAILTLKGLPLGNVIITEDAFESNCNAVTPELDTSWFSEPLHMTLTPGEALETSIVLRPNGRLVITSQFVTEGGTPEPGFPGPECTAQRTVHLVAGNGGLAWYTILWPVPEVITAFNPNYAYDAPQNAKPVPFAEADHPLFTRNLSQRFLWEGLGKFSQPSVFVAGANQTHTASPLMTTVPNGVEIVAAGAQAQAGLAAPVPVLSFKAGLPYGPATGSPAALSVTSIDSAVAAIRAVVPLSPADEQELRPSATKLASWIDASSPANHLELARNLLFAANAFRMGLVSTVVLPALNDDPHGAFAAGDAQVTARANGLARILDSFYAELAANNEKNCGHAGQKLSLADNVVMIVSGDTPKNPFNRNGWSDGTPGGTNLLYFRSNGFLKAGWFGRITSNGKLNFDPASGQGSPSATPQTSLTAAQLGILFAITRGNMTVVTQVSPAPFQGLISAPLP